MSRFIAPFVVLGAVAGCRPDGLDTKLSTELHLIARSPKTKPDGGGNDPTTWPAVDECGVS